MPHKRTLAIFAKQPAAGLTKTRLAAETSPEWAAQVAEAFLRDTLHRLADYPTRRVVLYSPIQSEAYFQKICGNHFQVVPQIEGVLGRRMESFLAQELSAGRDKVVLIGMDSPTLPLAFLDRAFKELDRADLVLGPATDGGYYLLGVKKGVTGLPPLFAGISWGTSRVLQETIARLEGWKLALLPPWYDVDTLEAWRMLKGHLAALGRIGLDTGVFHTGRIEDYQTIGQKNDE